MFSKTSRYKKLAEVVTIDPRGRRLRSTSLRQLPEISGTFEHILQDGDRLDHLGYKYYKEPRRWWRVCDANPEFLSPLALVGSDVTVEIRFSLFLPAGDAPWSQLEELLQETVGVESVQISEDVILTEESHVWGEESIPYFSEETKRAVIISFNSLNLTKEELSDLIETTSFQVTGSETMGRVGKKIIIPPKSIG